VTAKGGFMKFFECFGVVLLILSLTLFCSCASKPIQTAPSGPPPKAEGQAVRPTGDGKGTSGGIVEEELLRERQRLERERSLAEAIKKAPFTDIYFDFDSYTVRQEQVQDLTMIGNWLKQYSTVRIVVAGHTDERGTMEYNLVLGQKRAESVKEFMVRMGVQQERIKTVSFGKEMPAHTGHGEEAWAKNRRVHFAVDDKR
jgi:peptidoglycan-associated lipoprotein